MANKDFKVKNGLDIQTPLPVSMGGTGQTSTSNTLNSLLPAQSGNANKVLSTDGTNTTWVAQALAYQRGGTASRPASPTVGDLYYNTDNNYFESYTANGWFPIAAAPGIPTGVTATNQGSGRAFNNGQMSVAFTPNSSGGAASSFIVTPSPSTSPSTFTGSTSPITVTGLASSTQYTYTVQATSPYGTSSASSASSGVTATTVPQAPTIGTATAGDTSATLTFTANSTGGSAITNYKWSTDGTNYTAFSPAQTTSPLSFTGLTNGNSYAWYIKAVNANGDSSASSISNSITPAVQANFYSLATQTLTSDSSTIVFSNIPSGYTHLRLIGVSKSAYSNTGTGQSQYKIQFGGGGTADTGNSYSSGNYRATSTNSKTYAFENSVGYFRGNHPWNNASGMSGYLYTGIVLDIINYSDSSKVKMVRYYEGYPSNSSSGNSEINYKYGVWNQQSAINYILLDATTPFADGPFAANSTFTLFGVK